MSKISSKPSDLVIVSRWIDTNPLEYLKENRIWHGDGIMMTHFINAFQAMFPEGERVFIDAIHDCQAEYPFLIANDPVLKSDVEKFIEQEARHSVVHDKWTKALMETGYTSMIRYDKMLHDFRNWIRSHLDKMTRLSFTIGAEQYTASLAKLFVHDKPEIVLRSGPPLQKIFLYHAMEELEHKGVCYDLYKKLKGGYFRRIFGMTFISFYIWFNVIRRHRYLLQKDGEWKRKRKHEFLSFYLGTNGMMRALIPKFLEYMRPSFYPWQNDERQEFEDKFGQLRDSFGIEGFHYKGKKIENVIKEKLKMKKKFRDIIYDEIPQ